MAVPPAGCKANNSKKEDEHLQQLKLYKNFIKSEAKIKVVTPFLWQSFNSASEKWIGARDSAELKDPYIRFYNDYMNNAL